MIKSKAILHKSFRQLFSKSTITKGCYLTKSRDISSTHSGRCSQCIHRNWCTHCNGEQLSRQSSYYWQHHVKYTYARWEARKSGDRCRCHSCRNYASFWLNIKFLSMLRISGIEPLFHPEYFSFKIKLRENEVCINLKVSFSYSCVVAMAKGA